MSSSSAARSMFTETPTSPYYPIPRQRAAARSWVRPKLLLVPGVVILKKPGDGWQNSKGDQSCCGPGCDRPRRVGGRCYCPSTAFSVLVKEWGLQAIDFAQANVPARLKCHRVCKVEMTPGQSHSAPATARTLRDGRPLVGIPGASRLFGGRWRRGSPRLRFGGYDACRSRANASAAPSRLFSTIAPGATVWILSNIRKGSATPLCRTAKRPSG